MKKYAVVLVLILSGCSSVSKQVNERLPQQVVDYGSNKGVETGELINSRFEMVPNENGKQSKFDACFCKMEIQPWNKSMSGTWSIWTVQNKRRTLFEQVMKGEYISSNHNITDKETLIETQKVCEYTLAQLSDGINCPRRRLITH